VHLLQSFLSLFKDIFVTSLHESCNINLILMMKNFAHIAKFMALEMCGLIINFSPESKVNKLIFKVNDLGRILQ